MAHTKSGAKARQKANRAGKRLGLKMGQGQSAAPGNIIIRQRGSVFHPGQGARMGKDHTIFAITSGTVKFSQKKGKKLVAIANG